MAALTQDQLMFVAVLAPADKMPEFKGPGRRAAVQPGGGRRRMSASQYRKLKKETHPMISKETGDKVMDDMRKWSERFKCLVEP